MSVSTKRFCPICKSENISFWLGGYTGAMYQCAACGYVGPVVIETSEDIPRDKKDQ